MLVFPHQLCDESDLVHCCGRSPKPRHTVKHSPSVLFLHVQIIYLKYYAVFLLCLELLLFIGLILSTLSDHKDNEDHSVIHLFNCLKCEYIFTLPCNSNIQHLLLCICWVESNKVWNIFLHQLSLLVITYQKYSTMRPLQRHGQT